MSKAPGQGKMKVAQKPKNMKKAIGSLLNYCRSYLPAIVIALVLAVTGTIFALIGPNKLNDLTELISAGVPDPEAMMAQSANMSGEGMPEGVMPGEGMPEGVIPGEGMPEGVMTGEGMPEGTASLFGSLSIDMEGIKDIAFLLIVLYSLSCIFSYFQGFIMATATQNITRNLRTDISRKINKVPLSYFNKTSFGDVLSRVTNDVDMIGQTLNMSISQLVTAVTQFIGSLIMMFYTNWIMTIAAVGCTIIGLVLMGIIMGSSQKYFIGQQTELGNINGHIEEMYTGHDVVRVYNGTDKETRTFNDINNRLYESAWKSQFLSGIMMPVMNFIGNLGYVAVFVIGALLIMNGKIGFGVIVAFTIYIRLFTNPLSQIAQAATTLQTTAAASERIFELLDEEEMDDESGKTKYLEPADTKGLVEFEHVNFGYVPDKIITKDFSAVARPGQKVAIVGPTGAGKTTMVNLLMRFYELNSGSIRIDGIPTSELTRKNVHDLFGMVLQDTWLFEGTVRENIAYGKQGVTDEDLTKACKAVGIYHFIRTLPKGYDTVLNDKVNLSAGQKQLITIARAMIENAPLLILDEATSSVDTRTEIQIQRAMDTLTKGRTSFVIAHRLSTIKNADLILVMKDGDIIESGDHEELLAKDGFYAELYNSQFESVPRQGRRVS